MPTVVEIAREPKGLTESNNVSVQGWVWISNDNIDRKQHERFFFDLGQPGAAVARLPKHLRQRWQLIRSLGSRPLTQPLRDDWDALMDDYARGAGRRSADRERTGWPLDEPLESAEGDHEEGALSRHVLHRQDLMGPEPVLAFARLDDRRQVATLLPVHISREMHPATPRVLLDDTLGPARERSRLSPADRVFGWVGGGESHRGQLRVAWVRWRQPGGGDPPAGGPAEPIRSFEPPLALAVLSGPKPQQARFYVGDRSGGTVVAQPSGADRRSAGYRDANRQHLRGRKVYPHQVGQPDGHWRDPSAAAGAGPRPEYLRESDARGPIRDDQNQSVEGWIKPETEFELELQVVNLSEVELGALLWLLQLPAGWCLRLGAGKPLGFGSVRVELLGQRLETGEDVRARLASLAPALRPRTAGGAVAVYKAAIEAAYGCPFDQTPFIAAFQRAARGTRAPVHYPRTARRLAAEQKPESYEWFTANEQPGQRHSLPDLASGDPGLPYLRARRGEGRGGRPR